MATFSSPFEISREESQQLEEKYSCSICLSRYVKPRTLPCSHTFCHSCLVNCLRGIKTNQRFFCPICRTDTKIDMTARSNAEKIVEHFPIDYKVIHKMKTALINTDSETDKNFCKPCLRDTTFESATVYCCECSELLCGDCKKHHSKNKLTTDHTVVDIKSDLAETQRLNFVKSLTKCNNHQHEEVRYLCKDHDQLCCNECAILSHRQCQILQSLGDLLTSGFQKCVKDNIDTMETLVEKMTKHEMNHRQNVCNSEIIIKDQLLCIKDEFDNTFRIFEENILRSVGAKCDGIRNSISSQQMRISKFKEDLKHSKDKMSSVEQYGQDLHMYLLEREMKEEMEQNERELKSLHQNTNCTEVSLTGIATISKQLNTCLQKNISVIIKDNASLLPKYPTIKHSMKKIFSSDSMYKSKKKQLQSCFKQNLSVASKDNEDTKCKSFSSHRKGDEKEEKTVEKFDTKVSFGWRSNNFEKVEDKTCKDGDIVDDIQTGEILDKY